MGSLGWGPDCLGAWFPLREEAPGLLGLEGLEFFTLGQASSGCREGAGIHPTGGGLSISPHAHLAPLPGSQAGVCLWREELTPDCCVWRVTRGRWCFYLCNETGSVGRRRGSVGGALGGGRDRGAWGHRSHHSVLSGVQTVTLGHPGTEPPLVLAGAPGRTCSASVPR